MYERVDILGLTSSELAQAASRLRPGGAGLAARIYARAFADGRLEPEAFGLSKANAGSWRDSFIVGLLEPLEVRGEEGEFGRTEKALLRTHDGHVIECVKIPMPPRSDGRPRATICASSQVGCRMGCAFCETGRSGLTRNLSAAEIVSQLVTARALLGWEVGNLVFMGMGEPLDNLPNVSQALKILTDPRGLALSWERITVCTSGDSEGIAALRESGHPRLNLSLSLNAGDDETRTRLMPANRKSDMAALAAALKAYPRRRNFVLGLNYCLLPGINDALEHARGVADFAREVGRSFVNLIPYNPGSRPLSRAPEEAEIQRFQSWLEVAGCLVKRRTAKGSGIMAACGQLGGGHMAAEGQLGGGIMAAEGQLGGGHMAAEGQLGGGDMATGGQPGGGDMATGGQPGGGQYNRRAEMDHAGLRG
jgi:23S rRNA (adenine2503-C2)-methyltransferase